MDQLSLLQWLHTPCMLEDAESLSWNPGILYLPIEKVLEKIQFMEDNFKVTVNFFDLHVFAHNSVIPKGDTIYNSSIRVFIPELNKSFVGAHSFSTSQYCMDTKDPNYQFAGIAKSLAIVNAFSCLFEQFGKGLNDKERNPVKNAVAPKLNHHHNGSDAISATLKSLKVR